MTNRELEFHDLRSKLEQAGFQFEREQKPHFQKRKELELVFVHPALVKKFEMNGYKVNARKFYIKPLTDDENSEIGLVTGKTSPLYKVREFSRPNSIDSFDNTPAWSNKKNEKAIDELLGKISSYIKSPAFSISKNINAYLFAWNPTKWKWTDLKDSVEQLEKIGYLERRWSCGNSKNIKKGDRVFLIRVAENPKGIMGSGYAKSSHYMAPHWDGTPGKTTNYIDIEFDILINPESNKIFGLDLIRKVDLKNFQQWFPQQSGISIKPEIIDELESNWFNFITENKLIGTSFVTNDVAREVVETYFEGKSKEVIQTRYERNPQARKTCLEHHGFTCQICDFNFEFYFGELGRGFIHVHHINPIATIGHEYKIDPQNDLIPVCPNCHVMIHAKRPAFSIEEIRNLRRTAANNVEAK